MKIRRKPRTGASSEASVRVSGSDGEGNGDESKKKSKKKRRRRRSGKGKRKGAGKKGGTCNVHMYKILYFLLADTIIQHVGINHF